MEEAGFVLRAELRGHSQDVRCACAVGTDLLATASRDCTVRLWALCGDFGCVREFRNGHTKAVGAVAAAAGLSKVVSAGYDNALYVWDCDAAGGEEPSLALLGHTAPVCCVSCCASAASSADIVAVSGSWDLTCRVWRGAECRCVCSGHSDSVWAVLILPGESTFASASDDKTIRLWSLETGAALRVCDPLHTARVRGLSALPEGGFLSCSNDCSVALWTREGHALAKWEEHTSFVYAVSARCGDAGQQQGFVSCGEDRALRVWKLASDGARVVQTLVHPGTIWHCAYLPNGDVVTSCADGVARIWTRDHSKVASEETISVYEASLAEQTLSTGAVGRVEGARNAAELLTATGRYDGDVQVFQDRDGGKGAFAYRWVASRAAWEMLGEVVDGPAGETVLDGVKYDRVFDVELDGRHFKLGYDLKENPYVAAQKFIHKHDLEQDFLDEIARWIMDQTGQSAGSESFQHGADAACDPLTGAGRYVPGSEERPPPPRAQERPAEAVYKKPSFAFLPQTVPTTFSIANTSGLLGKLSQASGVAPQSTELSDADFDAVKRCLASETPSLDIPICAKMLQWPQELLLPVFGVFSLLALRKDSAAELALLRTEKDGSDIVQHSIRVATAAPALQSIILRMLANALSDSTADALKALVHMHQMSLAALLVAAADSAAEATRHAAATVCLNIGISMRFGLGKETLELLLAFVASRLRSEPAHNIVGVAILALGTLLWESTEARVTAQNMGCKQLLREWISSANETVRECAMEASRLFPE